MAKIEHKGSLFGQTTWCVYCKEVGDYTYNGKSLCKIHLEEEKNNG